MNIQKKPLLSIVTVTWNANDSIRETIESVRCQSFRNYEYIFIDGNSSDNTLDIIREYENEFSEKCSNVIIIQEKDKGIYDAMNKAIRIANGDWIYFLNSGDTLYDNSVLSDIEQFLMSKEYDVLYGGTFYHSEIKKYYEYGDEIDIITKNMPFCSQSSFVRTKVIKLFEFDLNYSISADYDFFIKIYQRGFRFHRIDRIINRYLLIGFSSQRPYMTYLECANIKEKYGYLNTKSPVFIIKKIRYYLLSKFMRFI